MKHFICFILFLLLFLEGFSQANATYNTLVREAYKHYQNKDYKTAGEKYLEAFKANGNLAMVNDRYDAACSFALSDQPDAAFDQLFRIAKNGNFSNLSHLMIDGDLTSLHEDTRWAELIKLVKANKEKTEAKFDKPLVAILDTIYQEDQGLRQQIGGIMEKHGMQSPELIAHFKLIREKDSVNLNKVTKILDERGWLGPDIIGKQGNQTLFLVIQHSDQATMEKYLPMMQEAVKNGKANASNLALLEDRVALGQGKKQIYGSQIGTNPDTGENFVLPLEDPDHVNDRRTTVGLGPIEEYLNHFGLTWDVEAYKKFLLEMEAKEKK